MIHVVLYQPQIPPNTGNIIRFCANTGIELHLVYPLGFRWEDKQLRRAGLDYTEFAAVHHHDCWSDFLEKNIDNKIYLITTKGSRSAYSVRYHAGDMLVFGSENAGIAQADRQQVDCRNWLRIPMQAGSRSMNLSNAVALLGYEALRQLGLPELR